MNGNSTIDNEHNEPLSMESITEVSLMLLDVISDDSRDKRAHSAAEYALSTIVGYNSHFSATVKGNELYNEFVSYDVHYSTRGGEY
jgi:hypothetical protein